MSVEIVTNVKTLMTLAKEVGNAKKNRDKEQIKLAEAKLQAYEELIKQSDRMIL